MIASMSFRCSGESCSFSRTGGIRTGADRLACCAGDVVAARYISTNAALQQALETGMGRSFRRRERARDAHTARRNEPWFNHTALAAVGNWLARLSPVMRTLIPIIGNETCVIHQLLPSGCPDKSR